MKKLAYASWLLAVVSTSVSANETDLSYEKVVEAIEVAQLVECRMGTCFNLHTGEKFQEPSSQEGYIITFPPGLYSTEEIQELSPYVVEYVKEYGLP